jgi:predicted HTH transcriptional regulator
MTEQELLELCSLGESTTVQYKLEFTTQKNEDATQKANKELIYATQKEDVTTQKSKVTTRKPLNTTQKRILDYLKDYPKATRQNVADALGNITVNGVKFNIGLLQQYGALERKGGRKNGEWVVIWRDVDDNVPSTEPLPLPTNC